MHTKLHAASPVDVPVVSHHDVIAGDEVERILQLVGHLVAALGGGEKCERNLRCGEYETECHNGSCSDPRQHLKHNYSQAPKRKCPSCSHQQQQSGCDHSQQGYPLKLPRVGDEAEWQQQAPDLATRMRCNGWQSASRHRIKQGGQRPPARKAVMSKELQDAAAIHPPCKRCSCLCTRPRGAPLDC